ncbi:hypothetical protein Gotri_002546 [Gossypium trilobum]|uniref:RNase H type-1 domain-containing protein n=1 Tax=Gossypium trilobum TaxID=34281 RepID=A0A7J9F8W1_9ROSI|nr:hypothetical protein [Gossypium trilobum]
MSMVGNLSQILLAFPKLELVVTKLIQSLQVLVFSARIEWKSPVILGVPLGYFNTILAFNDKRRGQVIRKRCSSFGEFMDSSRIHDLGFKGDHFTWQRGGVSKRLNRAIRNKRLLADVKRVRWVLGHSSACGVCGHISEDVLHVLRDCPVAADILKLLIPIDRLNRLEDDSVAAREVVRDRNRECIIGYKRFLGRCSVFEAELWGLLDGLNILIDRGLDNVMIQTDSLEVVGGIQYDSN